ncbi:MAG: recombination-associated protein RdgC [Burkholderiales bacterium]|nr:recombination-associated protein RdgC [Burkholderiales bacterium]
MFKNLTVYRIGPQWSADLKQMEDGLNKARFVECGATQPMSFGWVAPRGTPHAPLIESVAGHHLLKLMIEQKVVPGAVVKRRTEELAKHIEDTTGRKPGKKQTKEIKEQALLELLPMAFTKQSSINVWIAPKQSLMMVDASSQTKADEVVAHVVKAIDGLVVNHLQTTNSPAVMMSEWLVSGEPPATFTVDRECELKSTDEMKSVVRYSRHLLDTEEVRQHITSGKVPTKLAMTWESRVSFLLTDTMQIKKLSFLDVVFDGRKPDNKDEAFDADAAIATGELSKLIPDLVEALGGELPIS